MSAPVAFLPSVALYDTPCFRCIDLGILWPTVIKGDEYFSVLVHEKVFGSCCEDCFNRLREECD